MGIAIEQNAFSLAYCRSKQGLGISTSVIRSAGLYSWRHQLAYGRQLSERWQFGLQWTLLQWSAPSENWRVSQGNWGVYGIYSIKDELQLGFGGRFPHRISQAADEQLSQTQVLECALIWRMGPDGALSTGFRSGGVAQRPWQIGYEHSVSTKFSVRIGCSGLPLRLATSFAFEWHSLQFQFGAEWDPLLLPGLGMEMNHAH